MPPKVSVIRYSPLPAPWRLMSSRPVAGIYACRDHGRYCAVFDEDAIYYVDDFTFDPVAFQERFVHNGKHTGAVNMLVGGCVAVYFGLAGIVSSVVDPVLDYSRLVLSEIDDRPDETILTALCSRYIVRLQITY